MRTTINDLVGRQDGVYASKDLEVLMAKARKLLADTSALLELEIDRLFDVEAEAEDPDRIKTVRGLIAQTQKAMQMVLEIEAKAGLGKRDQSVLDLEAAREEIIRRFDRLVA